VLDYLLEEVLQRQPESIQTFLLCTSILDRMCGPLCDALLETGDSGLEIPSQQILEYLERANLFIVPLDHDRHWYRYHHLFAELLRQRLQQKGSSAIYHLRASAWLERNGLTFEAFRHATAAQDVERAIRLIESEEIGLHFRGVALAVMDWLAALPEAVLDAHPLLRVRPATLALMAGQTSGVEEKIQAAEKALLNVAPDANSRDLIGQIACARATLALMHYDPQTMVVQARRALEYLSPNNLNFLFTANWALASALLYQGDRVAATQFIQECIAISRKSGHVFSKILATSNLGYLQELDNQLYQAADTYRSILPVFSEHPQPNAVVAYLGLARIYYQWNDLETAERYAQQSLQLARLFDREIDRFIVCEVFLAHLRLAHGELDEAAAILAEAEQTARQKNFTLRLPEIAAVQVAVLIRQGQASAAARLALQYDLPLSQAGALIAQGNPSAALAVLEPLRRQMETRGLADERLKTLVLQALAQYMCGGKEKAAQVLGIALELAEPGGFIRLFVDEGVAMAQLLSTAVAQGIRPSYANKLLAAFAEEAQKGELSTPSVHEPSPWVEPLSPRELEVLRLIAQGLSNQEIGARLCLALDTIKGHNRRIFDKLQVQRRTEAIARATELGLL
jgi:LuxR family maltose regulon positive regulatory protein